MQIGAVQSNIPADVQKLISERSARAVSYFTSFRQSLQAERVRLLHEVYAKQQERQQEREEEEVEERMEEILLRLGAVKADALAGNPSARAEMAVLDAELLRLKLLPGQ